MATQPALSRRKTAQAASATTRTTSQAAAAAALRAACAPKGQPRVAERATHAAPADQQAKVE
eukprot:2584515-Pleurochrysis_carterae.AAC.1